MSESSSVSSDLEAKVNCSTPVKDKQAMKRLTDDDSFIASPDSPASNELPDEADEECLDSVEVLPQENLQENEAVDASIVHVAAPDKSEVATNKKSKKPRRRRLKKNKSKSLPLSEMSENCIVLEESE